MEGVLEQALSYAKKGLSVIQVGQDKKPIQKWQEFRKESQQKMKLEVGINGYQILMLGL